MITKKIIMSIILLLTYSLGFAHNFVPHHHDSDTEIHEHSHESEKNSHHHHNSIEQTHQDHDHFSHGDHFDDGFYDLLICFLHDAEHHEDECNNHYFIPAKANNLSTNKSQKLKLFRTLITLSIDLEKSELTYELDVNSTIIYRSPPLNDSPLRGPPSIS